MRERALYAQPRPDLHTTSALLAYFGSLDDGESARNAVLTPKQTPPLAAGRLRQAPERCVLAEPSER
jgi:hypothetical protein